MRTSLLIASIASVSLFACRAKTHETPTEREPQSSNYPRPTSGIEEEDVDATAGVDIDGRASNDAEAIAFLNALDYHEIKAAADAQRKTLPPDVMEYARMLYAAHSENLATTQRVTETLGLSPLETDDVNAFEDRTLRKRESLAALEGDAFAEAYVAAMVEDHAEGLEMIDDELLQVATSDSLRQHLTQVRGHVAAHLEGAKSLQAGFDGQADGAPEDKPEGVIPPVAEDDADVDVQESEGTHPVVHEGRDDE